MVRTCVAAVLVVLAVAAPASAKPPPPSGPVRVQTSFSPGFAYFGDPVVARVDVDVDRLEIDPTSVVVAPSFGRWEQLGTTRLQTESTAAVARRTEWYTLTCLAPVCLPRGASAQVVHLPPLHVTARARDGSAVKLEVPWAELDVAGRFLPPTNGAVRPAMRLDTHVPAAVYRADPTWVAAGLDAIGGLALAAGLALVALELVPRWLARRRGVDTRPPLVRALALLREAQGRDSADRRRAAALIARLLPEREAATAAEVAWSRPDPSAAELEELAAAVEPLEEARP